MSSYESHSFRIGAASLAAENGMSDAQIRGLSRWKSDGFKLKLYIRSSKTWTNFQLCLFFRLLQSWARNRLSQLNNQFSTILIIQTGTVTSEILCIV